MHLLTSYALTCGAKIDKPFIYEAYIPLPPTPFISFHTQTKFNSKNYDYWQEVIHILKKQLDPLKISIIQTGGAGDPAIAGVIDYRGKTTVNQLAYIVKRSNLHFGSDSFAIHLASAFDVPLVSLYNIIQPENAGPYFGTSSRQIIFDCCKRLGQKPSYSAEENPKTINSIFPEEIAEAIFKLLEIKTTLPYKTAFIGDCYGKIQINDFIPNQVVNVPDKNSILDVRMDYSFDENILAHQLQNNKCRIFTDKRINIKLLEAAKNSIDSIYYFIKEDDEPQFAKDIVALGIRTSLISSLPQSEIDKRKINYYELGNIHLTPKPNLEVIERLKKIKNLEYKSCRFIHSKGQIFSSRATEKLNQSKTTEFQPVIDSPEFWDEEYQTCFFVERLD